jgi:predicted nucleotidyltransferase
MIDVSPEVLQGVLSIIDRYAPECEVRAFGSRVKGTPKTYSDLDLALVGDKKLTDQVMYSLKEAFEESDIPFRVDFLDWNAISHEFQNVIKKEYVVIRPASLR